MIDDDKRKRAEIFRFLQSRELIAITYFI